jgi:hypothetical protein
MIAGIGKYEREQAKEASADGVSPGLVVLCEEWVDIFCFSSKNKDRKLTPQITFYWFKV